MVFKRIPVNNFFGNQMNIFERLKEERNRLGFNQTDFAAIGGVQKLAQINYESGKRNPDSNYLAAIAEVGADVNYILTGRRLNDSQSRLTANMIKLMDALNETQQREILHVVEEKKRLNELEEKLRNVS